MEFLKFKATAKGYAVELTPEEIKELELKKKELESQEVKKEEVKEWYNGSRSKFKRFYLLG